tara:strand:- start:1133 stop:2749 length:1617 start_codon:yes stop_codon:yes gene_type:complete
MLTPDQEVALYSILEFIKRPVTEYKDCANILYAAAGCGKTFLTRIIADKLRGGYSIAGVAPTHKARKVLDRSLNTKSFYTIKTMTVASLLNKLRAHSYIGTKLYSKGSASKMSLYNLFIIDEASMINDNDIQVLVNYAFEYKKKILFVGDKYQIPNPSQKYICEDGWAYKADSLAFNIPGFELTTNIRQKKENPIVSIYLEMRNAIAEKREPEIDRVDKMDNGIGVKFISDTEKWSIEMTDFYLYCPDLSGVKIIAYTNDTVKNYNQWVRQLFARGPDPEVGELLMGYNNLGFPETYISNGQDYWIRKIQKTKFQRISPYINLVGSILNIQETDTEIRADIFIPHIGSPQNQEMLQDLAARAEKVNSSYSTKQDYKKYCALRNSLVFMENVYKYKEEIVSESSFRNSHPLLFKSITEVIDCEKGQVLENKMTDDIVAKYGNILDKRVRDNKSLSGVEKLCDMFCIIEKDIDYSYAITAHKSQGSTYKTVFVDEADFDKLKEYFNYHLNCKVNVSKEKTQLKYVSFTRPSQGAYIFYRE